MEHYLAIKMNKVLIQKKTWMNCQRIMLSEKKKIPKVYLLFDSIYIALLKRQSYKNGEKMRDSQGLHGDGGLKGSGCGCKRATGGNP